MRVINSLNVGSGKVCAVLGKYFMILNTTINTTPPSFCNHHIITIIYVTFVYFVSKETSTIDICFHMFGSIM